MHVPRSTLGYRGYDPDKDRDGSLGIYFANLICQERQPPQKRPISPSYDLEQAARIVFTPLPKKSPSGKASMKTLHARLYALAQLGVTVREDYLSLNRRDLLRHLNSIQQSIISLADKTLPTLRSSLQRPISLLDDL